MNVNGEPSVGEYLRTITLNTTPFRFERFLSGLTSFGAMIGVDRGSRVKGNVSRIYFIEDNLVKSRFFEFFRGEEIR